MLSEKNFSDKEVNYSKIASSSLFKTLLRSKKNFILPMTIFFFVFYFALPVMTSYSTVLNTNALGDITWAWIFAFAQFVMTWALCIFYSKKAARFDSIVDEIKREEELG
ncbi:DUF485 domain-containing protein [Fictibacillus sp. Mic-4]|uniref:DUF485 domain-containing protein n=1 Tax=Fictibacillus TaxID=1329200 RepID=UPI00042884C9|nr:DUF485 domain-containing protein [Fictibacillus gelatini]